MQSGLSEEEYENLREHYGFTPEQIAQSVLDMQKEGRPIQSDRELLFGLCPEESYSWDDKGFAELFAELNKNNLRYNTTAKQWYFFDGVCFRPDEGSMRAMQKANQFAEALTEYCGTISDERKRAEYRKTISKYGQLRLRETLVKDARVRYFISHNDLDKNTDLLNCKNITLNLKTGEVLPHRADDLISKACNVVYDPEAKSVLWEKFVSDIMRGDKEKTEYLQKILGYSLTADTSLETCFILYGSTTRNGKSTLVETISHMLGDYSRTVLPQSLALKQNKDARTASGDIARLCGCRFVSCCEPPKKMAFDASLLKTILGRDSITARNLYEREFEFIPQFKLFINTNYLPQIDDDTLFSSGRINVITFDRHFSKAEQDMALKGKLRSEENLSGILNWCLEGLRKFYAEGAKPPETVRNATQFYRNKSDRLSEFISTCLVRSEKNLLAGEVYRVYQSWSMDNGYEYLSKGQFLENLRDRRVVSKLGTVNGSTCKNVLCKYDYSDKDKYYVINNLK